MNNDLISRSALRKAVNDFYDNSFEGIVSRDLIKYAQAVDELIDDAPTVEERPTGEWIKITKTGTVPVEYICSVCGRKIFDNYEHVIPQSVFYPYCHCGARMEGGEDETGN